MSDIFKKEYNPLIEDKTKLVLAIKEQAEKLYKLMDQIDNREMSLAKTNLEQAAMWATKSVVLSIEVD